MTWTSDQNLGGHPVPYLYVYMSVCLYVYDLYAQVVLQPPKRSFLDRSRVLTFSYLDMFQPISRSGICAVKSFPAFPPRTIDVAHFNRGIFVLRNHAGFNPSAFSRSHLSQSLVSVSV